MCHFWADSELVSSSYLAACVMRSACRLTAWSGQLLGCAHSGAAARKPYSLCRLFYVRGPVLLLKCHETALTDQIYGADWGICFRWAACASLWARCGSASKYRFPPTQLQVVAVWPEYSPGRNLFSARRAAPTIVYLAMMFCTLFVAFSKVSLPALQISTV